MLDKNDIDDEGAKAISRALVGNQTLSTLNLSSSSFVRSIGDNEIGAEGATEIAQSLLKNRALGELYLGFSLFSIAAYRSQQAMRQHSSGEGFGSSVAAQPHLTHASSWYRSQIKRGKMRSISATKE